jgi:ABC-type transport system involved in cytochrome c biogenesis permease subunit
MLFFIKLLEYLLPVFYFVTIWMYAKSFFSGSKAAGQLKTPFLITLVIAHGTYLVLRTIQFEHPPMTNVFETFSNIAFCVTLAYMLIELRTKVSGTGYFILILPFFFQLASSVFIKDLVEVPELLRSNLLAFHVTSALLGYASITVSAVYGFLYLMLYHDIKSTRFGVIYNRLPNLEVLERMSVAGVLLGFIMLTIAIAVGIFWLPRAGIEYSYTDPKLVGTAAIWLIYGIGLTAKKFAQWQGRRIIVLSMFGFIVAMFSMTIINMFFSDFHKFH